MAVILCFVSGPALMKVDPDGCDLITDCDTPRDLSLCFGMADDGAEKHVKHRESRRCRVWETLRQ